MNWILFVSNYKNYLRNPLNSSWINWINSQKVSFSKLLFLDKVNQVFISLRKFDSACVIFWWKWRNLLVIFGEKCRELRVILGKSLSFQKFAFRKGLLVWCNMFNPVFPISYEVSTILWPASASYSCDWLCIVQNYSLQSWILSFSFLPSSGPDTLLFIHNDLFIIITFKYFVVGIDVDLCRLGSLIESLS